MPQAVLVRHKLDIPCPAIAVQIADLFARDGRFVHPVLREGRVGERKALDIELQLIVFEHREPVDERAQILQRRHLATADIKHKASHGKRGRILNFAARNFAVRLQDQLPQRSQRVKRALRRRRRDAYALRRNRNAIALGTGVFPPRKANAALCAGVPGLRQQRRKPGKRLGQHNAGRGGQRKSALLPLQLLRCGDQDHGSHKIAPFLDDVLRMVFKGERFLNRPGSRSGRPLRKSSFFIMAYLSFLCNRFRFCRVS